MIKLAGAMALSGLSPFSDVIEQVELLFTMIDFSEEMTLSEEMDTLAERNLTLVIENMGQRRQIETLQKRVADLEAGKAVLQEKLEAVKVMKRGHRPLKVEDWAPALGAELQVGGCHGG